MFDHVRNIIDSSITTIEQAYESGRPENALRQNALMFKAKLLLAAIVRST